MIYMAAVDIIPGIFEKDWTGFAQKVALAAPYTSWVHVDVLDGTMVEGSTLTDFSGLPSLKENYPRLFFEAHFMVANPDKYIKSFVDAGFSRLIAHVESNDPRNFLAMARFEEVEVGLAIDGTTEIVEIEPFIEEVDFVVVLSAEAGAPDRPFLPEAVEKVKLLRQNYPDLVIEVIGGISDTNIKAVKDAGATRVVSTSYIFRSSDVGEALEGLRRA